MSSEGYRRALDLSVRTDFRDDGCAFAAYVELVDRIFDVRHDASDPATSRDPNWIPFACFDPAGHCVACTEATTLDMRLDGENARVTAVRLAGVAPAWRRRGLFRKLMDTALAWCATAARGPTLLYTEDHALYRRFGFSPVPQHAFVGPAPEIVPGRPARILDLDEPGDRVSVAEILARRAPVSQRCALLHAPDLFLANMAADGLVIAYAEDLDALIAYEIDGSEVVLVDVVCAAIPSMAHLLGRLPLRTASVRVLFPPDQLEWIGTPEPDETGLMARGALPDAMCRPFMLPPTTDF